MLLREILSCVCPLGFLRLYITSPTSRQEANTSTNTTTNATDRRVVADGGSNVVGENSVVNITDANSLQRAADLGEAAIISATQSATATQTGANALALGAIDLTKGAFSELTKAYSDANTNAQSVASGSRAVLIGGLVMGGIALVLKLGKKT